MSIINEKINLMSASALSYFVKGCLLQNRAYIENNGEAVISATEALNRLEELKSCSDVYESLIENSIGYRKLCNACRGAIDFTDAEIDEIAYIVRKSVEIQGLEYGKNYWDVISFAVRTLDKVSKYAPFNLSNQKFTDLDYELASKWKGCLQLVAMPIFYKPFACVIQCGNPYSALRIANDENKTLYDLSNSLEVRTNELSLENIFDENYQRLAEAKDDAETAIEVAVNWWTCALTDVTYALRYYSSPSFMSSVLALARSRYQSMPTDKEIEVFKEYLAEEIRAGLATNGHYSISTSSQLDPVLDFAIKRAGFVTHNFSWETTMDISPEQVSVVLGENGHRKQILFDSSKDIKRDAIQKIKV